MKIQLKRSNVLQSGAAKEPTASQLEYGELAINYSNSDPAIFLKDSNNNIIRISGVGNIADDGLTNVPAGTTPPTNPTPESGNLWYNSDEGRLYIYYVDANTSQWVDASPDSWDPTVMPVTTNPAAQTGTLDDRYVMENGDTMTGALLLDNAASASAPDLSFDGDANTGIYSPGSDQLALATNGTGRLFVASNGHVGINEASPEDELHITQAGNSQITIENTSSSCKGFISAGNNFGVGSISNDRVDIFTNNALCATFDSSGRLLVGTSSSRSYTSIGNPQVQLEGTHYTSSSVGLTNNQNAADSPYFIFNKTRGASIGSNTIVQDGDQLGALWFQGTDGSAPVLSASIGANVDGTPGSSDMPGRLSFFTTASGNNVPIERMRIDSSGRLLVGTSSARSDFGSTTACRVQVEGTDFAGSSLSLTRNTNNNAGPGLQFAKSRASANGGNVIVQNNDVLAYILFDGNDGTDFARAAQITAEVDGTPGANDMPGRLVFSTTAGGNSSPTERISIGSNGALNLLSGCPGIDFSDINPAAINGAVMTSELLDSYEEGTWTPTLLNGGTINNVNNATYVRIGRLITAYMYISVTGIPNNSTAFQISGLPFNGGIGNNYGGGNITYSGAFDTSVFEPVVIQGGSYIYFHRTDGIQNSLVNSDFTGLVDFVLQVAYMAA